MHERHVDDVFGNEPDLQLVTANHVADDQIVRAILTGFNRTPGHRTSFLQHDFVRMQQSRDLDGDFFTAFWGSWDQRRLGYVVSHRDTHAAEQLDPLSERIDRLVLLLVVFVEQKMELMESRPRSCQWCFLYKSRNVIVSASSWLRLSTLSLQAFSASAIGSLTRCPNG